LYEGPGNIRDTQPPQIQIYPPRSHCNHSLADLEQNLADPFVDAIPLCPYFYLCDVILPSLHMTTGLGMAVLYEYVLEPMWHSVQHCHPAPGRRWAGMARYKLVASKTTWQAPPQAWNLVARDQLAALLSGPASISCSPIFLIGGRAREVERHWRTD
jgi:hypothetical protein